jgi:gliding motility-associated-like protein
VKICAGKNCKEIVRLNSQAGRYKIDFQVYYDGCIVGEGRDLEVKPVSKLVLPNIVSKTGINGNDRFALTSLGNDVTINNIRIYNRWGNILFSADNLNPEGFEWDLKVNGVPLQNGVYLITVDYTNEKGLLKSEKGDLLILD